MRTKLTYLALALLAGSFNHSGTASTVSVSDPQAGGIGYKYTVTMSGEDSAVFSSHVGAWSWEDQSLFNAANGEDPVGWTHTSNWVAVNLTAPTVFKIRIERDATVPWPSVSLPDRLASVASMFPSFTIWKNWDNDLAPQAFADANNGGTPVNDWHTYNNDGAVAWAEDLVFTPSYDGALAHYNNSTLEVIERTYLLPAGQYSIVIGSNAPATDTDRQGYKATFTTSQDFPVTVAGDSYFVASATKPLVVPVAKGILENDLGIEATDTLEIVTQPTKGSVVVAADGSFTYTPGPYFGLAGFDAFTYRFLINGDSATPSATGTATISTFAAAAGAHAGHIENEDTGDIAGLVKLDVTRAGKWTAVVCHLGKKWSLTGALGLKGELTGKPKAGLDIELELSTHGDGDRHAHVHIHGGADHFEAHVKKSPFSKDAPPPSLGMHSVALAVTASSTGAPTAAGTGKLKVNKDGTATLTAKLGDKTTFSCGTVLVKGSGGAPSLPVYAGLYKNPIGSVSGDLTFGATAESSATGSLEVIKPTQVKPAAPGFTITYGVTTTQP